jgi:hypothetical protein
LAEVDLAGFSKVFYIQTLQRKLKDAGRFIFADRRRGNPNFLQYVPATLRYIRAALEQVPQMQPVAEVLRRHLPELR